MSDETDRRKFIVGGQVCDAKYTTFRSHGEANDLHNSKLLIRMLKSVETIETNRERILASLKMTQCETTTKPVECFAITSTR